MKIENARRKCAYLAILAIISSFSHKFAFAENERGLSMVFDPETKKYFIGKNAKFVLKEQAYSAPADGIEISVDGGDFMPYVGTAVSFNEEGKHTLKFRAKNPVANWSPVQFMDVFVDLTAPTSEVRFVDDKVYRNGDQIYVPLTGGAISLVAQDNLSGVAGIEYSWDNGVFKQYTKAIPMDRMGRRTLYYRCYDRVGNTEPTKTVEFIVDGAPPYSTLKHKGLVKQSVLNGKPYLASSDSVAFSVEAADEGSNVKETYVSIDGAPFSIYQKPIYFLQDGAHVLKYYSLDNVGNREENKLMSIYIVSIPPRSNAMTVGTVVNTGGINFANRSLQLKLEAKDNVVGLERIEIKINEEKEFHPYLEPIRFERVGPHSVTYRAVDRVGNMEPSKIYSVHIHETAPETNIETAQPVIQRNGINYSASPNIVTLNVKNNAVGLAKTVVSINDGAFKNYDGPLTLTSDQKVFKIVFKSIDKLGNEEQPKSITYHMVGTIPVVDLFVSDGKNNEEQVRTNYFDQPASPSAAGGTRNNASDPTKKKKE